MSEEEQFNECESVLYTGSVIVGTQILALGFFNSLPIVMIVGFAMMPIIPLIVAIHFAWRTRKKL